ncbi:MAG TPA: hypothetical protein VK543_04395 [Puia sp.]|nr:hypothetical protein [Puia sp.]
MSFKNPIALILVYFICSSVDCQPTEQLIGIDSLRKYCYYLVAPTYPGSKTVEQGTGFFVRIKKKIFLVTACHVLIGWDPILYNQKISYPDTFYVKLYRDHDRYMDFKPLNVLPLKTHIIKFHCYDRGDLYFYEIKIESKYDLHSLEKMVLPNSPSIVPDEVIIYGYPSNDTTPDWEQYIRKPSVKSSVTFFGDFNNTIKWVNPGQDQTKHTDLINYTISYDNIGQFGKGYSGAPGFFRHGNKITFGGICFGGDTSNRWGYIIRPKYIREQLITLLNKN